jgi:membrane fusion protein, multidrug efflux system
MKKPIFIVIAVLAMGGAAFYWWTGRGIETTDNATIEAHVVPMAPRISGIVTEVAVEMHQRVKAGDLLARIDPRDAEVAVLGAKADLAAAEARLNAGGHVLSGTKVSANIGVDSAQAQVAAAAAEQDRAAAELKRMRSLTDAARSRRQLDEAVAAEKTARSVLADAKARLQSAQTAPDTIAAANANVADLQAAADKARADVATAENMLADTEIRAPFDGTIAHKTIEEGAYVYPGQVIMSVVGDDRWIIANFKETQLEHMKQGQPVAIKIDALDGMSFKGHVKSIQRGTGARFSMFPPENATGNFVKIVQRVPVKILFDAQPGTALPVGPGMSVEPEVDTRQ